MSGEAERAGLPIHAFRDAAAWEAWLADQPRDCPGLWLKLAKKSAKAPSVGKGEAIDGALIHGWIDGWIHPCDDDWWLVRFTPRRPKSKWSENNRKRAEELSAAGRMKPAGQIQIDAARADGRWDRAYASQGKAEVPDDLAAAFAAKPEARAFFDTLTGANRYAILYRIHDAKKPETRAARIEKFVGMCARGETVHPKR
jgi:uncharacterized protein YdeI (YjbR/CyaY-like superfamily)